MWLFVLECLLKCVSLCVFRIFVCTSLSNCSWVSSICLCVAPSSVELIEFLYPRELISSLWSEKMSGENVEMSDESAVSEVSEITDIEEPSLSSKSFIGVFVWIRNPIERNSINSSRFYRATVSLKWGHDAVQNNLKTQRVVLCDSSLTTTYNSASVVILQLHLPTGFLHVIKY